MLNYKDKEYLVLCMVFLGESKLGLRPYLLVETCKTRRTCFYWKIPEVPCIKAKYLAQLHVVVWCCPWTSTFAGTNSAAQTLCAEALLLMITKKILAAYCWGFVNVLNWKGGKVSENLASERFDETYLVDYSERTSYWDLAYTETACETVSF